MAQDDESNAPDGESPSQVLPRISPNSSAPILGDGRQPIPTASASPALPSGEGGRVPHGWRKTRRKGDLWRIFLPGTPISTRPSWPLRQTSQSVSSRFPATPKLLGETATTSVVVVHTRSSWDSKAAAFGAAAPLDPERRADPRSSGGWRNGLPTPTARESVGGTHFRDRTRPPPAASYLGRGELARQHPVPHAVGQQLSL